MKRGRLRKKTKNAGLDYRFPAPHILFPVRFVLHVAAVKTGGNDVGRRKTDDLQL